MTQSDAAASKVVETPCISVAQLSALRAFFDSILAFAGNLVPVEGGTNGKALDLSQRDPAPSVSQLTEPERRKALELLQTLLAEASTQAREKTVENQAEACNDLPVAGG